MAYTTKSKIENYLAIDIDSSFADQISDWISAVESYINNYTGRKDGFENSAASVRYFDGNGETEIDIDEFTSLSSVEILEANGDDVEWALTEGLENDYITYPYNKTPQYRLILTPNASVGAWYKGKKRIKVKGVWGHSTSVPADIELVTTMLVASIIEKGLKGGKVKTESLGDYSVTYADINETAQAIGVKKILDAYKIYKL